MRYRTFLASDFEAFRSDLETKIGTRTFPELAAHHSLIHVQFQSANQGLSEVDKCRYLRAAIGNHISFTTAITSYLTAHPLIAQQTFSGILNHITQQAPNFPPVPIDLGYAASVSAPAPTSTTYFESAAFAAYLDKRITAALPRHPQASSSADTNPRAYCFKHCCLQSQQRQVSAYGIKTRVHCGDEGSLLSHRRGQRIYSGTLTCRPWS